MQLSLTCQLSPGGHTADRVNRVAAETVVQQLTISNSIAQQDSIDLLLRGALRGERRGVKGLMKQISAEITSNASCM